MHIETEIKGDVLTLRLEGNPLGKMHARALYQNVQRHMNEGVKHVVVNLADVKHINSAGIGGLMKTWGVDLRLNTNVRKILKRHASFSTSQSIPGPADNAAIERTGIITISPPARPLHHRHQKTN